jgi:hypothetical protein
MVTAGLIGTKRRIDRLDAMWLAIFAEFGVTSLHVHEFIGSRGEFATWKGDESKRSEFLRRLVKAAKVGINKSFVVYLERPAYDAVNSRFALSERVQGQYAFAQAIALVLSLRIDGAAARLAPTCCALAGAIASNASPVSRAIRM